MIFLFIWMYKKLYKTTKIQTARTTNPFLIPAFRKNIMTTISKKQILSWFVRLLLDTPSINGIEDQWLTIIFCTNVCFWPLSEIINAPFGKLAVDKYLLSFPLNSRSKTT